MKYLKRVIDLVDKAKKKSYFLFGPRQTGKTQYLKHAFPRSKYYNLLESDLYLKLSYNPSLIREEIKANECIKDEPIIIDEVQKLPFLLDEVHNLIENENVTFILTGSSARKLKHGGANLLGGRARTQKLYPFVFKEIPEFDLNKALNYGTIPSIYYSDEPRLDLESYCGNYLYEEIQSEGAVRKIANFSRFLKTSALYNGELINYENIGSDCSVSSRTVREYYKILEDTLVGSSLLPYKKTFKRKPVSMSKFYFFDIGVSNVLSGRFNIEERTELFGNSFEHFIYCEIRSFLNYTNDFRELTFWRSNKGDEVDFIIGDDIAIEVKSSKNITEKHLKGLKRLSEEVEFKNRIIISREKESRVIDDILVMPWDTFLNKLWNKEF